MKWYFWMVDFFVCNISCFLFCFFKNFLLNTCPFLGPLIPLFRTSSDISSGFQSQSGFCLIRTLRRCTWYMFPGIHLWCATSASVHSWHSSQSLSPHACFSRGRMPDLNHRPPAWQADALTTRPKRPGFICNISWQTVADPEYLGGWNGNLLFSQLNEGESK